MAADTGLHEEVVAALASFVHRPIREAATYFLGTLGYRSDRTLDLGDSSPNKFLELVRSHAGSVGFDESKALFTDWKSADLLFQLTDEELSHHASLFKETVVNPGLLHSYVFFAIELTGGDYTRGKLTGIARQINLAFPMPVMVLIKHLTDKEPVLSITVINRRQHKRDVAKDVLGKVTIIRDIRLTRPHRGHLDILASFSLPNLTHPQRLPIDTFDHLHAAWEEIFNIELLNKRFYRELANWYFWAVPQVDFPADVGRDDEKRRATSLIRLLTRLIFCWFLKEKGLIPEKLFVEAELKVILKDLSNDACTYYQAILQNLFFATLNQRMGKDKNGRAYRAFARDEDYLKNRGSYNVDNLYRYEEHFRDPATALDHFAEVPFLNGGLFECLDRPEEGSDRKLYIDGFSRNRKTRAKVPNRLFFAEEQTADLSDAYGEAKKKNERVRGLLRILHSYKFTIVENTPIDQEIALDPELLGKVFENLLASYNEETKTTARKLTGSFYTPRPIVEYMVDESLQAHLNSALTKAGMSEEDACSGLDILFTYSERQHPFDEREAATLLDSIHTCKILDPACGSGAFPMGMLQKLVYIIHKLDPNNARWKQLQIDAAAKIPDPSAREAAIAAIEHDFTDNEDDYGRKLYLIENCLYGVDIQPIAIQISKLRFFISLVCEQRTNRSKKDNHGIRPLPNLETKFVAANSLIGLPEIEQLALVPERVYKMEAQIESLYHSHFAIQRRDQKLAVQRKIKDLRNELGRLLAESLMAPKKAQHLADWDPFDPQTSSDFFDPHWMFGRSLADGFDIIIGNPPYRVVKDRSEKAIYDKLYKHQDYQKDLYLLFCERAQSLLNAKGVLAYITPNTWMYSITFRKIRSYLRKNFCWRKVLIPKSPVFTAVVDNVVFIFQRGSMESGRRVPVDILKDPETIRLWIDEQYIPKDGSVINLSTDNKIHDLYRLILSRSKRVNELFYVYNGVKPFEKGKGTPPQTDEVMKNQPYVATGPKPKGTYWLPLLRGSLIERFKIRWNNDYWIKYGPWLAAPREKEIFAKREKIYVRQTSDSIIATFVCEEFVARNNLHILIPKRGDVDVLASLGVLNSSLTGFIYSYMNPEQGEALAEVKKDHVENLLLPVSLPDKGKAISLLTRLLIFQNSFQEEETGISSFLYDLIDVCVMECYFHEHMAERDLLFVDDIASYLAAYDPAASHTKQREFLAQLHRTFNAPSSKIRNRLLRLTADSPDLLAVIKREGKL